MPAKSKGAQAFPLSWPDGVPRAAAGSRTHNPNFRNRTVALGIKEAKKQLSLMPGAESVVVSTNVPLKANGDPYSDPGRLADPGAAVYFQLNAEPICLPCDKWESVEENLWAIAKHLEAMRGMARWGVGSIAQAFAGFKALPANSTVVEDWWDVFGLNRELATPETVDAVYKHLARQAHPDVAKDGGEAMTRLNGARDRARLELSGGKA